MKIEKLKPGMIVYDVGRTKMGNTNMTTVSVWPVRIISVDLEKRSCVAVWNMVNKAQTFYERSISKWREKEPMTIRNAFGRTRLATREEIKAAKIQNQVKVDEVNLIKFPPSGAPVLGPFNCNTQKETNNDK